MAVGGVLGTARSRPGDSPPGSVPGSPPPSSVAGHREDRPAGPAPSRPRLAGRQRCRHPAADCGVPARPVRAAVGTGRRRDARHSVPGTDRAVRLGAAGPVPHRSVGVSLRALLLPRRRDARLSSPPLSSPAPLDTGDAENRSTCGAGSHRAAPWRPAARVVLRRRPGARRTGVADDRAENAHPPAVWRGRRVARWPAVLIFTLRACSTVGRTRFGTARYRTAALSSPRPARLCLCRSGVRCVCRVRAVSDGRVVSLSYPGPHAAPSAEPCAGRVRYWLRSERGRRYAGAGPCVGGEVGQLGPAAVLARLETVLRLRPPRGAVGRPGSPPGRCCWAAPWDARLPRPSGGLACFCLFACLFCAGVFFWSPW